MTYYVGTMPVGEHLSHHGIKGMKWGQRRYQNPDGSLTAAGRARYGRYMQRAAGARSLASQNRAAAERTKSRVLKAVYGVNNRYYTRKAGRLSAKANRIRTGTTALDDIRRAGGFRKATRDARTMVRAERSSNPNRKRNLKRAAAIAGGAVAIAGAAYLGKKYGKGIVANRRAARTFNAAFGRGEYQKRILRNEFAKAKGTVRKAAGATGDAFRGVGYHARRAGAKAKNAARNVGYKAGNAPYFMKRTAKNASGAVKKAAKTYYRNTHGSAIGAALNAGMGAYYYGHSRRGGASKGQAAAVGLTRAATGRALPSQAVGFGVRAYNNSKRTGRKKRKTSK